MSIEQDGPYDDIQSVLISSDLEWRDAQKTVKGILRLYRERDINEVVASIILFVFLKGDEAIDFARKRGVFAYYSDGSPAKFVLKKILLYIEKLNISKESKEYLYCKYEVRWLFDYYDDCDRQIDAIIDSHDKKKKYFHVNDLVLESSIVLELLTYIELYFRLPREVKDAVIADSIEQNCRLDYDFLGSYSSEKIAEAVSYVISRYYDRYTNKNRLIWIDVDAILNDTELGDIILIAAKRKLTVEWEIDIDYYGYNIEHVIDKEKSCTSFRIIDKNDLEKTIKLGYIKTSFQEQARSLSSFKASDEGIYLHTVAGLFTAQSELIFKLVDQGTEIERYRMQFCEPLLNYLAPKDYDRPSFFMEEVAQIFDTAHEMFFSYGELLEHKISALCTVKDVILFKRFFSFVAYLQQFFLEEHNEEMEIVAKSIVPLFTKDMLIQLINKFVGNQDKANSLIKLYTWEGTGSLDIQTTPIIKLNNNQYVMVPYVLTISNLIRNVIVNERRNNSQTTNTDGNDDLLERFAKIIFDYQKKVFSHREHCKFKYNDMSGEVDIVVWSEQHLYLIECKNSILPTSSFELRTTYDYIRKAEKQLDLSNSALNDNYERNILLNSWSIPIRDYCVHTLILMGNRIFAAPNGFRHSIRYIHELDMILTKGIIESSFGKWRYWQNEEFSENDFLRYISADDPIGNSLLEAMTPFKMVVTCGNNRIERESYSLNIQKHWQLEDKTLVNLSTDDHMKLRAEFVKHYDDNKKKP